MRPNFKPLPSKVLPDREIKRFLWNRIQSAAVPCRHGVVGPPSSNYDRNTQTTRRTSVLNEALGDLELKRFQLKCIHWPSKSTVSVVNNRQVMTEFQAARRPQRQLQSFHIEKKRDFNETMCHRRRHGVAILRNRRDRLEFTSACRPLTKLKRRLNLNSSYFKENASSCRRCQCLASPPKNHRVRSNPKPIAVCEQNRENQNFEEQCDVDKSASVGRRWRQNQIDLKKSGYVCALPSPDIATINPWFALVNFYLHPLNFSVGSVRVTLCLVSYIHFPLSHS